jgi:hypothetical protein
MEGLGRWYLCTKLTVLDHCADRQRTPDFLPFANQHTSGVAKDATA